MTEPVEEMLVFRDRSSATIDVTHLDSDRYRIDDPLITVTCSALKYSEIVKAERDKDGRLVIQRRVKKGGFHTYDYILSEGWHERESVQQVLERVEQFGGKWDSVFGGILVICLPPTANYDPTEDISLAMK